MPPIRLAKGCAPEVAKGLTALASRLTPSHTITSRRYSIWSAIRDDVDAPFRAQVANFTRPWDARLLARFKPSEAWRAPPGENLRVARSMDEAGTVLVRSIDESLSKAEVVLLSMEQWAECLRLAIRSSEHDQSTAAAHFRATLDSVRMLMTDLRARRPSHGSTEDEGVVRDSASRSDQHTYCELCWRVSLRTAALECGQQAARARRLSRRFCSFHDPRDPSSRYRVDLRYKASFENELDALLQIGESAYSVTFAPPLSADEQEVRKTAYDLVHSRLRAVNSSTPGFRERIADLTLQKLTQAEIARKLGVTRQAVSKAIKSLERVFHARYIDAELSPRTGESLTLSGDAGSTIRDHVLSLKAQAHTPASIANKLGRFRHSIECLLIED